MDMQRRQIAPCTDDAWEALEEAVRDALTARLIARRVVDVEGAHGWKYSGVSEGRVQKPSGQEKSPVEFGVRVVNPLVEARTPFQLSLDELDNITRGALDPELEPLEKAAVVAAEFEDNTVFQGLKLGGIAGLAEKGAHTVTKGSESYLVAAARAVDLFRREGIAGPYTLVLPSDDWREIVGASAGYPMERHISELIGGKVIPAPSLKNAFVLSTRGGDTVLTLGQDFTLRYCSHDESTVAFDLVESFVFRVIEPRAIVRIVA